jgi:hypothetical protein
VADADADAFCDLAELGPMRFCRPRLEGELAGLDEDAVRRRKKEAVGAFRVRRRVHTSPRLPLPPRGRALPLPLPLRARALAARINLGQFWQQRRAHGLAACALQPSGQPTTVASIISTHLRDDA